MKFNTMRADFDKTKLYPDKVKLLRDLNLILAYFLLSIISNSLNILYLSLVYFKERKTFSCFKKVQF